MVCSCFIFKCVLIVNCEIFQGALDLSDVRPPPKSPEGKTSAHSAPSKVSGLRLCGALLSVATLVTSFVVVKVLFCL